ncbi:21308_t:CDS:1, partial [Racocetra persica]
KEEGNPNEAKPDEARSNKIKPKDLNKAKPDKARSNKVKPKENPVKQDTHKKY